MNYQTGERRIFGALKEKESSFTGDPIPRSNGGSAGKEGKISRFINGLEKAGVGSLRETQLLGANQRCDDLTVAEEIHTPVPVSRNILCGHKKIKLRQGAGEKKKKREN